MAIFSRPVSISPSCYELGHCWTPYCRKASTDIAGSVFREALKIYGTLYLVAGILRKKGPKYYIKKFIPETLRSSVFLTINGTMFLSMFCIWRKLFGYYLYYNVFICGIPACMLCILVEQKARRGPLAVYLTNLAIETGYRMLVERKLITPVPHGEVLLFSAVSAVYLYLFRKQNGLPQATESLFRFFVGSEENPTRIKTLDGKAVKDNNANTSTSGRPADYQGSNISSSRISTTSIISSGSEQEEGRTSTQGTQGTASAEAGTDSFHSRSDHQSAASSPSSTSSTSSSSSSQSNANRAAGSKSVFQQILQRVPFVASLVRDLQEQLKSMLTSLEQYPRHKCCPHDHSCLSYILKGGARMFTFGYSVQAAISFLSVLTSVLKKPSLLKNVIFSRLNLKLAGFLGGYSAIFRTVNCILRWVRNKDSEIHGCVAGALAGLSLRFYRSVTIALYAATKLVEILYFKGIESYGFPYVKCADIFIYAFSTAFIFHAAVMEPHTLRPGYWKFLLRVTDNRFAMMNRHLLDVFGVNSSKLQQDYWPDYDPAFTTLARPKS